ncbi:MAG: B12-binding domain-containing radical SAM protein [Actinobacteria bacterium]|nr:B12-binding domain-containing radical SAM protein [Actinomycetota bacterium]
MHKCKNILLVYPKYSKTFWSFDHILEIIGKKAAFPPLGLLSIASMLPENWNKILVDMNVENLKDSDIQWADFIFISAMIVQKESVLKTIEKIKKFKKPIVAGGPLFTTSFEEFSEVDHIFLGEAEETLPIFLEDTEKNSLKRFYSADSFPDVKKIPVPSWDLVKISRYNSMCIQYSRGCPFNCEFCDVVILNGRYPRTKTREQIIAELDILYKHKWRGGVFLVDDNLIGNKKLLKREILPEIIEWQRKRNFPFSFNTQVSINLSDDEELIKLLTDAGFTTVFIGIETPDEKCLEECSKFHNKDRDLVSSVKKLQNSGLEVQGGFIVGFDSDTPTIFQRQIEFIQKSGIVTAMVGLLTAIPKTRLYQRLLETKRIIKESSANNTLISTLNFIPKMDTKILFSGHKKILDTIYGPKAYYERIRTFLKEFKPPKKRIQRIKLFHLKVVVKSIWCLGIKGRGRRYFWRLFIWALLKYPGLLPYVIGYSFAGIHFRSLSA